MECKKCKAQLEPGIKVCPECGTDNTPESPKGIVLTPGKLVAVIACVVLLTAAVVALIMTGMGFRFSDGTKQPEATEIVPPSVEVTMAEPTIPADGNPNDATCKGSYTVSDDQIAADMANVVATVGDRKLTNAELQIYYWMEVQGFLGQYGAYASYLGLDYTQPLDTQVCSISDGGETWQQYFLAAALADWHNYAALAEEGEANDYALDQEYADLIAGIPESLAADAAAEGFASAEEYMAFNVGMGASVADYQTYMTNYYEGFMYFKSLYDGMIPTEDEMQAYYAEHEAEYVEQGINQTEYTVDVRHILVLPEGATVETIYTETFSEEAWAVGEQNANEILEQWLSMEQTEDNFALVANEHSQDPGSNTNGGLYTNVYVGQMVPEFENWCFDENRQVGDYGIVKTELGYHIMYLSAFHYTWKDTVMQEILSERGSALILEINEKYPITVDYSMITLGYIDPNNWL